MYFQCQFEMLELKPLFKTIGGTHTLVAFPLLSPHAEIYHKSHIAAPSRSTALA